MSINCAEHTDARHRHYLELPVDVFVRPWPASHVGDVLHLLLEY
jgi:hypothetical protein